MNLPERDLFRSWEFAKPLLETAIHHCNGTHTIDDICLMVGAGKLTLLSGHKSALLVHPISYPRKRAIVCFLGAGDKDELIEMRENIVEPYARENGFDRVEGGGRDGWRRSLPGFVYGGSFMYKDLS